MAHRKLSLLPLLIWSTVLVHSLSCLCCIISEFVSDIPKVPMPPIKNKKEDIALKDTVCSFRILNCKIY